jgi:hypothetical protein
MPKIESWDKLPANVRRHLIERMRDRAISLSDLNELRFWIESLPEVLEGDWYKDSAPLRSAVKDPFQKRFCFPGKQPRESAYSWPPHAYAWRFSNQFLSRDCG